MNLIGRRLGSYEVMEELGQGGMAVVYKGYQASLNRYVAIKVLRGDLAGNEEFVSRFRREALAVGRLSHPNILHVYDTGVVDGLYYLVMDYADGGTLKDLIRRGPMDPSRAVSIVAQMADALDYAHKQDLIHRDVKPSNILMTRDGRPLLTDFGIARALHQTQQLTRTGTSIGTPEYMAPEQAQGSPIDGRTDIYALGIVLYEMLAGLVPFRADTPVATMYRHVHDTPAPLRSVNANVPPWLVAVTERAMAKQPQDRYQTAGELAAALRRGPSQQATPQPRRTPVPRQRQTPPPVQPKAPSAPRRSCKAPALLIGLAVVLCLILTLFGGLMLFLDAFDSGGGTAQVITAVVTPVPPTQPVVSTAPATAVQQPTRAVVAPTATPIPPKPTDIPTIAPPLQPTPNEGGTWYIAALEATVTYIEFFEGGDESPAKDDRVYDVYFDQATTRRIYYEVHLEYPERTSTQGFQLNVFIYGPDGNLFAEYTGNHQVEVGWDSSWHTKGWGWDSPGNWDLGTYWVEFSVDGELVATGSFEIN